MKKTELNDLIIEMRTDIKWIKKSLQGNGRKGLIERVSSNERWRYITLGGLLILSTLIGWGLIILY